MQINPNALNALVISSVLAVRRWLGRNGESSRSSTADLFERCAQHFASREYQKAIVLLSEHISTLPPDSRFGRAWLGAAYYYNGQYEEAARELSLAVPDRPDDCSSHYLLACALVRIGDLDLARTKLTEALQRARGNKYYQAIRWWCAAAEGAGAFSDAVAGFELLLRDGSADAHIKWSLADDLLRIQKPAEAKEACIQAIGTTEVEKLADLLLRWCKVASEAGFLGISVEGLEMLLDKFPTDDRALNNLAILRAGAPVASLRDGHRAVTLARRACEITAWQDWRSISALAAAYAETGDFDEAIRFAEVALRLAPPEEKHTRRERIEQYRRREPYRIKVPRPNSSLPAADRLD